MNKKGFTTLNDVVNKFGSDIFEFVVVERDEKVVQDYYDSIVSFCHKYQILYYKRGGEKKHTTNFKLKKIAIGWRWLIIENENLIVLHDSLLPKYRGFTPLVTALINGEKQIGVTSLLANKSYDTGDVLIQKVLDVSYPMKIKDAITIISELYSKIVIELINSYIYNIHIQSSKQNNREASYSMWRDELDYQINWHKDATYISRQIDALGFPYQGAQTYVNSHLIKIFESELVEDVSIVNRDEMVGKVIFLDKGKPIIVCGNGLLKIHEAIDSRTGKSLLPLKKIRLRFGKL